MSAQPQFRIFIAIIVVILTIVTLVTNQDNTPDVYLAVNEEFADDFLRDDIVTSLQGTVGVKAGIAKVSAQLNGVIVAIYVSPGDFVTAGQILAKQDDRIEITQVNNAEAQLQLLEAQIAANKLKLKRQVRDMERLKPLVELGAATEGELEQAEEAVLNAQIAAQSEALQLAQAKSAVENAKGQLDLRIIRSPVDGQVAEVSARLGAGSSNVNITSLFSIIPDSPLIVYGPLNISEIDAIKVGQKASVYSTVGGNKSHDATVIHIANYVTLDDTRGSFQSFETPNVEITLELKDRALLIGQNVNVDIWATSDAEKSDI